MADALNATVPVPLPLAPLVTVNHDVLLLTPVHAHPAGAVTAVDPVPPAGDHRLARRRQRIGARRGRLGHVNVWPPIVSVPVRALVVGLADALNATVPVPLPLAPLVTVNHDVLLLTPVHAHPAGAVTAVDPVPPPATTDWLVGSSA